MGSHRHCSDIYLQLINCRLSLEKDSTKRRRLLPGTVPSFASNNCLHGSNCKGTTDVVQKYHLMQKTYQSTVWQSLIKLTKRSGRNQLLRNVMFTWHVDLHALLLSDCPSPRSIRYSYRNCASGKRWSASGKRWSSPRCTGA